MVKILMKRLCALLALSTLLQFGGCLSSGLAREVLIDQALDFLTGNNTILNLFTSS